LPLFSENSSDSFWISYFFSKIKPVKSVTGQDAEQKARTEYIILETEDKVTYATDLLDTESDVYKKFVTDNVLSKVSFDLFVHFLYTGCQLKKRRFLENILRNVSNRQQPVEF